jgi:hypothetical protein
MYKRSRRGQIRMTETIAILVIFFVLVMFGLIFFTTIQRSSFEQRKVVVAGEKAVSTSIKALFLPELVCTKGIGEDIKDCIDLDKLSAAQVVMPNYEDYYFDIFQFSSIIVKQIYPIPSAPTPDNPTPGEWILYQRTLDGEPVTDLTPKARTPIPLALFDPVTENFRYGVLQIDVFT